MPTIKKNAISQIIATFVIENQRINYNGKNYRSKYRYLRCQVQ